MTTSTRLKWCLVGLYLSLALVGLGSPEITSEDGLPVGGAVATLQGVDYVPMLHQIRIGNVRLPVMQNERVGATLNYVMWPFFWLFGVNTAVLRLGEILLALIVALTAVRIVEETAGPRAAPLAAFLILFQGPYFVYSRVSFIGDNLSEQAFVVLSAYFFVRWRRSPSAAKAFLWGLMAGFGVYAKLLLFWHAVAYAALFPFLLLSGPARSGRGKEAAAFFTALLLSPYNVVGAFTGFHALRSILDRVLHRGDLYHRIATATSVAQYRFGDFCAERGRAVLASLTHSPWMGAHGPGAWSFVLLTSLYLFLPLYLVRRRRDVSWGAVAAWLFVAAAYYAGLCVPVTRADLGWDHALPVLPLVLMSLAVSVDALVRRPSRAWAIVLVLYSGHLLTIGRYVRACSMDEPGPSGRIVDRLLTLGITSPHALMRVGDTIELAIESGGRIRPQSCGSGDTPREDYYRRWLETPGTWYMHWLPGTDYARMRGLETVDEFRRTAEDRGLTEGAAHLVEWGGRPVFKLFQLKRIERSSRPSVDPGPPPGGRRSSAARRGVPAA